MYDTTEECKSKQKQVAREDGGGVREWVEESLGPGALVHRRSTAAPFGQRRPSRTRAGQNKAALSVSLEAVDVLADKLPAFPKRLVEGDNIWPSSVGVCVGRMQAGHERVPCGLVVCRRTWPPQSRLHSQRQRICICSHPYLSVWCQITRQPAMERAIRSEASRRCWWCA